MEGKDENKPKIVYFILAVFIHANMFLPFLSEKTGIHGAFILCDIIGVHGAFILYNIIGIHGTFILCDIILAIIVYNLMARN